MLELSMNQVMKHMGTTRILENVNFSVYEGDRVGIIGANGSGKSTILKIIAGIEPLNVYPGSWSPGYDYGWVSRPRDVKVAYLDQMPAYDKPYKVIDVLRLAFEEALEVEKRMRHLEEQMASNEGESLDKIMKKYSHASEAYERLGGYEIHEKVSKVCTGLKFDEEFLQRPFGMLSGGEKTTVELGKLLIHQPEILLLDEPTNHLDTEAIEWLEGFLKQYKGIIVVVSHDRYFLDAVTTKTIEIEFLTTKLYKGNYSAFKYQKDELLRIQAADYKEQQKEIKAMKKKIQELRQWAMQSDNNKFFQRAASIQNKLDRMQKVNRPVFKRRNMRLSFNDKERSGKETIIAKHVHKAYDDTLLKDANLMVNYGDRVSLLGPNGCGKSTFVKMLMGEEILDSGELRVGANAQVAYLPQVFSFDDEEMTVIEAFREDKLIEEGKAREYLAKFMFYGKQVYTQVKGLSGGERIRLKLALLLYRNTNLLILDEPTNHLDIDSIETLEEALDQFEGTVFFVSHDRYFVNKIGERFIAIEDHQLLEYDNYDAYKASLIKEEPVVKKKKIEKIVEKTVDYEKLISDLEEELLSIENEMTIYHNDYETLNELYLKKCDIEVKLENLYDEWGD